MDTPVNFDFSQTLTEHGLTPLKRARVKELQINVGYRCNLACTHCHVEAGPNRTEMMSKSTMDKVFDWIIANDIERVDLTGGAPELHEHFRDFCERLLQHNIAITSRCNLTVLFEPGQEDLAKWYADNNITLVCSLPCYSRKNVEQQRGKGVFGKSIDALQLLNTLGYGKDENKILNLVYNPVGASLPPDQHDLETEYKKRLFEDFDIVFNQLFAITNLPVKRFEHFLERTGQLNSYLQLLQDNFNASTVDNLMCRHIISVDWQGFAYDCDFNQMLSIPLAGGTQEKRPLLWQINSQDMHDERIAVGRHCLGCTAGAGSSCGGTLA